MQTRHYFRERFSHHDYVKGYSRHESTSSVTLTNECARSDFSLERPHPRNLRFSAREGGGQNRVRYCWQTSARCADSVAVAIPVGHPSELWHRTNHGFFLLICTQTELSQ